MLNWLATLHMHHFGVTTAGFRAEAETGVGQANHQVHKLHKLQVSYLYATLSMFYVSFYRIRAALPLRE